MSAKRVHTQQLNVRHIGIEKLFARREELRTSLEDKRKRLRIARDSDPKHEFGQSAETWRKINEVILANNRFRQELKQEIVAEQAEFDRIQRQIRALNLPYGAGAAVVRELQRAKAR